MAAPAYPPRGLRRPLWLLLRWINSLLTRQCDAHDLHMVFSNGVTLCSILERLHPSSHLLRFTRALTRSAALSNIEQALALIWQHSPNPSAIPSATQILDGSPRGLLLRFISELFSLFVVRPAVARLPRALPWLQSFLSPYGIEFALATITPPHSTVGLELRTATAFACALHALLPPSRTPQLEGGTYGCPRSEEERARSVRIVFRILEAERLAPCRCDAYSLELSHFTSLLTEHQGLPSFL